MPSIHPLRDEHRSAPLRVAGTWGRQPWLGVCAIFLGGLIFGLLAYHVQTHGFLLEWDAPLANALHAEALKQIPYSKELMIAGFYLGREITAAIAFLLGSYYLYKKYWRELLMLALGFGGAGFWWFILSKLFDRPRPEFTTPIWLDLSTGSFPSGHALTSVVCYGFLAYLFASQNTSRFWKWVVALSAVGICLFIGYSRLYLGDHYLTDVLGGYGMGLVWAGLVFTGVELLFRKKEAHIVIQKQTALR